MRKESALDADKNVENNIGEEERSNQTTKLGKWLAYFTRKDGPENQVRFIC